MERPDLDAIEARTKAASAGPWVDNIDDNGILYVRLGPRPGWSDIIYLGDMEVTTKEDHANAEFIAHSRDDMPALVAYCRELEAQLAIR